MVSVCVLNWNRLGEIKMTAEVVKRLKIPYELIVFDQNSTDGSVEYLKSIESDNIKGIYSPQNVGNSLSRNKMVEVAKYDYILFVDGDIVPIENSIEEMYKFMIENPEYVVLGYDYMKHTTDLNKVTKFEEGIRKHQVTDTQEIPLTQYGMFRKSILEMIPFPTFYPFEREGWGAEDDLVGMALLENKLGKIGTILGRTYFHNHPKSSWDLMGQQRGSYWYGLRHLYYCYFKTMLNPEQKLKALQEGILPSTKVDLYKYHWRYQDNLGDVATHYIFKKVFPFIEFNEDSENLFFFGGSIFDHVGNALNERLGKKVKKVEMFGVGVSSEREARAQIPMELTVYPRGDKTYEILEQKGVKCEDPVGDVLQLFSLISPDPLSKGNGKTLYIRDAYSELYSIPEGEKGVKVAKNMFAEQFPEEFVDLETFMELCKEYSYIYSSQIHPFLIPLMLGKGGTLVPKDYRVEDLYFFDLFKEEMDSQTAIEFRGSVLGRIPTFSWKLFNLLAKYKMQ